MTGYKRVKGIRSITNDEEKRVENKERDKKRDGRKNKG